MSEVLAKPHAVSALLVLIEEPGISAARLARMMGANQPSTGRVMAKHLEKFKLVTVKRVPGPFRKSSSRIALTGTGEKLARALARVAPLVEP